MKSPLVYLTVTKFKNQIKGVLKSPSKLIYGIFLIVMLVFVAFAGSGGEESGELLRDLSELTAILTVFYSLMFLTIFLNGSSANTPMFTLSDVTLLFPSPLSPNRVLFYGLFRKLGASLVLGFFLLFQYSWLNTLYGITYGGLLLIVAGYALTLFLAQLCAMAVYNRTSGNEKAARTVHLCVYGAVALYILSAVFSCSEALLPLLQGGKEYGAAIGAVANFFSTLPGLLFPVSGWTAGMVGGLLTGNILSCLLLLLLVLVFTAAMVLLILKSKNNYYEDVLQTAELAQNAITAQREGQLAEATPKNVKVGKTGLKKGWGANAVYYKHMVENRRSGLLFLSRMSLIFILCLYVMAVFMRDMEEGSLVAVFSAATYMQLFSEALGRFNRELTKPYLYLIPEPPLKKLLYAVKENLVSDCWEALILWIPIGFILQVPPLSIALCILARISFALLFIAGNILVERVFGMVQSKALIMFFYFFALLLLAVPGIIAGIALTVVLPLPGMVSFFLGMTVINIFAAILTMFLCRNLLQYAELSGK